MKKVGGLARALYVLLAIVAGFVALGGMNTALILVVLGLVAGLAIARDKMVLAAAIAIVLPLVGVALGNIPAIGAKLTAVCANLQLGVCGALATAIAMLLYELVMDGVMGLTGGGVTAKAAHA